MKLRSMRKAAVMAILMGGCLCILPVTSRSQSTGQNANTNQDYSSPCSAVWKQRSQGLQSAAPA